MGRPEDSSPPTHKIAGLRRGSGKPASGGPARAPAPDGRLDHVEQAAVLLAVVECAAEAERPTTERHHQAYVALAQLLVGLSTAYRFRPCKGRLVCPQVTDDFAACREDGYLRLDPSAGGCAAQLRTDAFTPLLPRWPACSRVVARHRRALRGLFAVTEGMTLSRTEGIALALWLHERAEGDPIPELLAAHRNGLRSSVAADLRDAERLRARCRSLALGQ